MKFQVFRNKKTADNETASQKTAAGQKTGIQETMKVTVVQTEDKERMICCPCDAKKVCKDILAEVLVFAKILYALGFVGLTVANIVIGSLKMHSCLLQPLLPMHLVVQGAAMMLLITEQCVAKACGRSALLKSLRTCLTLFQLSWIICGTIWVAGVHDVIYSEGHCATKPCVTCDPFLTDFAFYSIIAQWILFALMPLLGLAAIWLDDSENGISPA